MRDTKATSVDSNGVTFLECEGPRINRRKFLSLAALTALSGAGSASSYESRDYDQKSSVDTNLPGLELTHSNASYLALLIGTKKVSAVELVEMHLKRIAQVNGKLNAVVTLDPDGALKTARGLDELTVKGKFLGPLHGAPMTVKDSIDTAGIVTTYGSAGRRQFVPPEDATVVKRLKAAGVVMIGKSNTPELTWEFETQNRVFGRTNNPWDLSLSPGGSSGGAAAAERRGDHARDHSSSPNSSGSASASDCDCHSGRTKRYT